MHENIVSADQRGHGLNRLNETTGDLADSAGGFRRGANRLRKKMWWKVSEHTSLVSRGGD